MTEEAFLNEIYAERSKTDKYFKSSSAAVQEGVKKRFARELADIQESLKVSKAWEEEQKKPEGERRSYEEVVKGITGKEPCASGQSSSFSNCSISGGAASGEERFYEGKNCAPTQYIGTYGNCMFCPLFEVIFNTASKMAKLSFDKLSHPIMLVVLVAWALWLAFEVMKHISSLQTKDAPTLFKTILAKGLVVMVVVIFLQEIHLSFSPWRWNRYLIPGLSWHSWLSATGPAARPITLLKTADCRYLWATASCAQLKPFSTSCKIQWLWAHHRCASAYLSKRRCLFSRPFRIC